MTWKLANRCHELREKAFKIQCLLLATVHPSTQVRLSFILSTLLWLGFVFFSFMPNRLWLMLFNTFSRYTLCVGSDPWSNWWTKKDEPLMSSMCSQVVVDNRALACFIVWGRALQQLALKTQKLCSTASDFLWDERATETCGQKNAPRAQLASQSIREKT